MSEKCQPCHRARLAPRQVDIGRRDAATDRGLLLGIRKSIHHRWLPAIAAAPGDKGPDRYDNSREGLAELMIMARPTVARSDDDDGDENESEESQQLRHKHYDDDSGDNEDGTTSSTAYVTKRS